MAKKFIVELVEIRICCEKNILIQYGGFDKLNHRNVYFLDIPVVFKKLQKFSKIFPKTLPKKAI